MAVPAISKILSRAHSAGSIRAHGKYMTLILLSKKHLLTKTVVVVGAKVSKLATDRNRVKRRIRSVVQGSPLAVVIIAKPASKDIKPAELREDFLASLKKLSR